MPVKIMLVPLLPGLELTRDTSSRGLTPEELARFRELNRRVAEIIAQDFPEFTADQ